MLGVIHWWLSEIIPTDGRIVDLGGGVGALAHSVLANLPKSHVELWDIDTQMIAVARERLSPFADRVTIRERSFTDSLDRCNAVIATLSLHHIPTLDAKRDVYANVFRALSPNGIFLIGDCTMDSAEPARAVLHRYWVRFMGDHGITETEARRHLSDWAKEDTYQQISDELRALAQAGFPRPEVFWREGPMAVYGGIKSDADRVCP
jgi:spermidine synthase